MTRNRQISLYGTLGVMIASVLVRYGAFSGGDSVVVAHDTIQVATQRLELLQRKAALVPGKEEVLKQVQAREKGVVQAGTAEEARAHLMDVLHRTALANGFSTQSATELPEPKTLGKNKEYGQVSVGQNFTCGVDQLVNFLAAIANEPEILATESIFVQPPLNKNKDIVVRLTLSGVIPRKLLPVKKGDNFQ